MVVMSSCCFDGPLVCTIIALSLPSQTHPVPGSRSLKQGGQVPFGLGILNLPPPLAPHHLFLKQTLFSRASALLHFPQHDRRTHGQEFGADFSSIRTALNTVTRWVRVSGTGRSVFGEGSTAAWPVPWLSLPPHVTRSINGDYFQAENISAPSVVPFGSYSMTDFHLPPQRTPHFSGPRADGREGEPSLGKRANQGRA